MYLGNFDCYIGFSLILELRLYQSVLYTPVVAPCLMQTHSLQWCSAFFVCSADGA